MSFTKTIPTRSPLIRFSVANLMWGLTIVAVFLAAVQVVGPTNAGVLLSGAALIANVRWTRRTDVMTLRATLACHVILGSLLFVGPICAYTLQERLVYDNTSQTWSLWTAGQSPGILSQLHPFIQPIIRFYVQPANLNRFALLGVSLIVVPPTAPVVAALVPIHLMRRSRLPTAQKAYLWLAWSIAVTPTIYMIIRGPVIECWLLG